MSAFDDGPDSIRCFKIDGRGTSYTATYGGHDVQVYVTEKRKLIRIFVDGNEWKVS